MINTECIVGEELLPPLPGGWGGGQDLLDGGYMGLLGTAELRV